MNREISIIKLKQKEEINSFSIMQLEHDGKKIQKYADSFLVFLFRYEINMK